MIEPYADRFVLAYFIEHGPVALYLAMASAAAGLWDDADAWYDRAAERAQAMGQVVHGTRAIVLHAETLRSRARPGDRERALGLVDQALSTAQEHGLVRLSEQALGLKVQLQGILKA